MRNTIGLFSVSRQICGISPRPVTSRVVLDMLAVHATGMQVNNV
jgi:hypothetical protein